MKVAKVIGNIWATRKEEKLAGLKLLLVQPLDVLTDVGNLKVSIISSGKTDKKTILYDAPTAKAKEIMRLSNGTACFSLFGRKEGEWRRVRVGGVSGWIKYTQTGNLYALGDQMRSVVPYYPLLMQTKSDTLLYQQKDDAASRYMTLGQGMYVELLAESDSYAYVRTSEGGSGAYDCGDFGFLPIANLSLAQTSQSIGVDESPVAGGTTGSDTCSTATSDCTTAPVASVIRQPYWNPSYSFLRTDVV